MQKIHEFSCVGKKSDQQNMEYVGDKNQVFYPAVGGQDWMFSRENERE
ncbi:MAG: hypothetical protein P8Y30_06970 [candidate division WOR-3 bacterium]